MDHVVGAALVNASKALMTIAMFAVVVVDVVVVVVVVLWFRSRWSLCTEVSCGVGVVHWGSGGCGGTPVLGTINGRRCGRVPHENFLTDGYEHHVVQGRCHS